MKIHTNERTLALAGIVQAATLVNHIARGRWVDPEIVQNTIDTIFIEDPQNVLEVFGGNIQNLLTGLRRLTTFFPTPDQRNDAEMASYLFGSILLSRALEQDKGRMEKLGNCLHQLNLTRHAETMTQDKNRHELAQLYVTYIGTLKRRIHVLGGREVLNQPLEVNTLRSLLLAAIRCSILWHQMGGRMWHLWWNRGKIVRIAKEIIENSAS